MDPIIGEFTITSGSNPADFKTSFPRSIRLEKGYEIALKSISHGPINNLLYPDFLLRSSNQIKLPPAKALKLNTNRFYETPSDILLELHKKILGELPSHRVPILFERDGYMNFKMPDGIWLEINENMFLNRVFKYTIYDETSQTKKRGVKSGKFEALKSTCDALNDSIKELELQDEDYTKLINKLKLQIIALESQDKTFNEIYFDQYQEHAETLKNDKEQTPAIAKLNQEMFEMYKTLNEGIAPDLETFRLSVQGIEKTIEQVQESNSKFEEDLKRKGREIKDINVVLETGFKSVNYKIESISDYIIRSEEPGMKQSYSSDNSQVTTSLNRILAVSTIAVSMTPIVKTDLAFLYSSVVANSLINNKESRLLTTIPLTSRRGYNYFQFSQPIYRPISVRQFMEISFEVLDRHGKFLKFNLFGDNLNEDQESREYPTILNLHIRKAIKG